MSINLISKFFMVKLLSADVHVNKNNLSLEREKVVIIIPIKVIYKQYYKQI